MRAIILFCILTLLACQDKSEAVAPSADHLTTTAPKLILLGTIQDAGSPQIGCQKECCRHLYAQPDPDRRVVSLGIVDADGSVYVIDATPDLPFQYESLGRQAIIDNFRLGGVFLTHAHIGHYAGLMYLGREAMGAKAVPVYAMPRMTIFLQENGPWDQMVKLDNIDIHEMAAGDTIRLSSTLGIIPF